MLPVSFQHSIHGSCEYQNCTDQIPSKLFRLKDHIYTYLSCTQPLLQDNKIPLCHKNHLRNYNDQALSEDQRKI